LRRDPSLAPKNTSFKISKIIPNSNMGSAAHVRLDRAHANLTFDAWVLGSGLVQSATTEPLPSAPYRANTSATDYVHSRNAALHNGMFTWATGPYFFLQGAEGPELCRLNTTEVQRVYGTPVGLIRHPPCQHSSNRNNCMNNQISAAMQAFQHYLHLHPSSWRHP